jgi:uncharacterized protein YcnI
MPWREYPSLVGKGLSVSRSVKSVAVIGAAAAITLLTAGAASAHVTVNPKSVSGGSYTQLTFRAPNETAKANFTKLTVHLPAAEPLGSVSTRPIPGWTATTTTAKLAKPITTDDGTTTEYTNAVTWTATGGGIAPDQYQNFDVSVGPLPNSGTMTFAADQSYSDGSVVHWDQVTKAGAAEPEHPAPVLTLTAVATDAASTGSAPVAAVSTKSSTSDGVARGLGIAGIVVGALGLGAAGFAFRRRSTQS